MRTQAPGQSIKFSPAAIWAVLLLAPVALGGTVSTCMNLSAAISCTGTLGTPEEVFLQSFTLAAGATITVQTYGFGGGTNAAGSSISPGGFDSLVALFSGASTSATILSDGGGNPVASADNLTLYMPGCPPALGITVGALPGICGDNRLTATLAAGTYTLVLTDANFVPLAVNPNLVLGPYDLTDTTSNNFGSSTGNGAYNDLSAGEFQTCASLTDCNTDSGNFAVDITLPTTSPVPEPSAFVLLAGGLALSGVKQFQKRRFGWREPR